MAIKARQQLRRPDASAPHHLVVAQAEAYLRAHIAVPVAVTELVGIVGLSERALRNAFYGVHAMGPKQWMLTERLRGARRALCGRDGESTSVTRVATDHGFYELGRFAVTYKRVFGEGPSETLNKTKRHDDARRK